MLILEIVFGTLLAIVVSLTIAVAIKGKKSPAPSKGEGGKGGFIGIKLEWLIKYAWSIVLLVGGLVLLGWEVRVQPTAKDIGSWSWDNWLPFLTVAVLAYSLVALNVQKDSPVGKVLKTILAVAAVVLFIVAPIGSCVTRPSKTSQVVAEAPDGRNATPAEECSAQHPCVLTSKEDGSTEPVEVPYGKTVCFEPWVWQRLEDLGLRISFQAARQPEAPFPCSAEQVYGGKCTAIYDHFLFKPSKKTALPNYWFVASGSTQC